MFSASMLALTLSQPEVVLNPGDVGPAWFVRFVTDHDRVLGAWLLFSIGLAAAAELWRSRTLGLALGGAFLLFLAVGGGWRAWEQGGPVMALATAAIHATLAGTILQPAAWRACRQWL